MAEKFTLTITCGDDGIHCSTTSDAPVSPCSVVGALEMCKLMMYENRTLRSAPAPSGEETGPVSKRRALIGMARKVFLSDEPLPVRAVNALHTHGIITLEDLLRYTRRPLCEFRNLGRMTLDGICRYVGRRGCELGSLAPVWYERMSGCLALSDLSKWRSFESREEMIDWMVRENARIIKEEEEGL